MTTPYSEPTQGQWYQFDPNVHYYYDEQGHVHYYDPNTNLDCEYQPDYRQQALQQQAPIQQGNGYYNQQQVYTPRQSLDNPYAEVASSRQGTPDVLLPCPEPTCNGENKPTSKFCEECGRSLGGISRSATPAANNNLSTITRAFSNQQIQDSYYPQQQEHLYQPPQPPLQRPPTAPVYSSSPLDSAQTVPLYHPPSTGSTIDPPRQTQSHLYYNGVQHQSMQDLYGLQQQTTATTPRQYNPSSLQQQQQQLQQQQQQQQQQYSNGYQSSVDPLDRARGCPIVSFGFGGKMLVTFPRTVTNYYSSTVKPQPGPIKIKYLKDISNKAALPSHALGPILFDSKVGTKQKKKDVGQYIMQMVETFEKQKETIVFNSVEYHQLQAKTLLYQLLKAMVETEGNINDK
jgi:hypothetical protein